MPMPPHPPSIEKIIKKIHNSSIIQFRVIKIAFQEKFIANLKTLFYNTKYADIALYYIGMFIRKETFSPCAKMILKHARWRLP